MKKPNRKREMYLAKKRYEDRSKAKKKQEEGLNKLEGVFKSSSRYGTKMRPIKGRKFPGGQQRKRRAGRNG